MSIDKIYKYANVLSGIPDSEVVKVAGVVRRLKNLFKQLSDKEYSDAVSDIKDDSVVLQETSKQLNKAIDELLSAIKDNDVQAYDVALVQVRQLSVELVKSLREVNTEAKEYRMDPKRVLSPSEEKKYLKHYTTEQLKNNKEEVFKQLSDQLPPNHDVEVGLYPNFPPLKSFQWFQQFSPEDIYINEGGSKNAGGALRGELFQLLVRSTQLSPDEADRLISDHWEEFKSNLKVAILDGSLAQYSHATVGKNRANRPANENDVRVVTSPFVLIPGLMGQMNVVLLDLMSSANPQKKLSFKRGKFLRVSGKVAPELLKKSFIVNAQDTAQPPLPRKINHISDLNFAKAMEQGYRQAFGSEPTIEALAGGWAQAVLESGRGANGVNLPNNNVGNIMATNSWVKSGQPWFTSRTQEFTSTGSPYSITAKWRAYPTPADGAAGYWKLLGKSFPEALSWYKAGDPVSAGVVLGENGYYTANIRAYSGELGKLFNEFMKKLAVNFTHLKSEPQPPPGPKPVMKEWKGDSKQTVDPSDGMISMLLASDRPLYDLVKEALSPKGLSLISIGSLSAPYGWRMRYAKGLAKVLKEIIGADITIHTDKYKIELECRANGTDYAVATAASGLVKCVSSYMDCKYHHNVTATVYPGTISKYSKANYV